MRKSDVPAAYRELFCARLQELRAQAGFKTQAAFANELGIIASTYQKYENYKMLPLHLIPRACEVLDCGPWYLLTGQDDCLAPPFKDQPPYQTCHALTRPRRKVR